MITLLVDAGALTEGMLILKVKFCLHFQFRAYGFWPKLQALCLGNLYPGSEYFLVLLVFFRIFEKSEMKK